MIAMHPAWAYVAIGTQVLMALSGLCAFASWAAEPPSYKEATAAQEAVMRGARLLSRALLLCAIAAQSVVAIRVAHILS